MPAPATKEVTREQPTRTANDSPDPIYYRPTQGLHLTKAGKVALGNWVGKIDGCEHRVYAGAPVGKVPQAVRAAMEKSRIGFGIMTMKDLGPTPDDRTLPPLDPELPSEE